MSSQTWIHPSKYRTTLAPKLPELILLWKHLLPLYFLIWFPNPDQTIFCTILGCLLDVNKLLRNQILPGQEVFYYIYSNVYLRNYPHRDHRIHKERA